MKKYLLSRLLILLLLSLSSPLAADAQYTTSNSLMRRVLTSYVQGAHGFYELRTGGSLQTVDNVTETYAYDKKARNLYVLTDNSNVVVTLEKDYAKIIKKNKYIPQLAGDELSLAITRMNNRLREKFEGLNAIRRQEIQDSILQAKQDSIQRVRAEEARRAAEAAALEQYRQTHDWRSVPIPSSAEREKCSLCDEYKSIKDGLITIGIHGDSIYYVTNESGELGMEYPQVHCALIQRSWYNDADFRYHVEAFRDSLMKNDPEYSTDLTAFNGMSFIEYLENLKKKAPYGFIEGFSWDDDFSVTFDITYTNMNAKTIKYIQWFFRITNAVGDVRGTGSFKGTGPVEPYNSGHWKWDSSSYFVAGDASSMQITKIIITYMDGTKRTLTGNQIHINK